MKTLTKDELKQLLKDKKITPAEYTEELKAMAEDNEDDVEALQLKATENLVDATKSIGNTLQMAIVKMNGKNDAIVDILDKMSDMIAHKSAKDHKLKVKAKIFRGADRLADYVIMEEM